jgi:hypothetical protein
MTMSEPSLVEVQRWMKARIRPGGESLADAGNVLNPQRGVPGFERLAVYAEGYQARIHEALAEVYEAVQFVVGKRAFLKLSRDYTRALPSQDYSLTLVGRHLPDFLKTHALTRSLPFLPDLGRLEWRVCLSFHAVEQEKLDPSELSSLPADQWQSIRLAFQPSVGVVASAWPILDLWSARKRPRAETDIALEGRAQQALVYRDALDVRCASLEPEAAALLCRLLEGMPLGQALGCLAEQEPVAGSSLQGWFALWMRLGLITGVSVC